MSPTPEPQGVYEDEEDEEPPSLTVGFDHTRRWAWPSAGGWAGREDLSIQGDHSGAISSSLVLPPPSRCYYHKALALGLG